MTIAPHQQTEIERRRLAREPSAAIAADYGVGADTVTYRTRHLGVWRIGGPGRTFDYAEAARLAGEIPVAAVAARLKTTPHAVWRALRVVRRGYS